MSGKNYMKLNNKSSQEDIDIIDDQRVLFILGGLNGLFNGVCLGGLIGSFFSNGDNISLGLVFGFMSGCLLGFFGSIGIAVWFSILIKNVSNWFIYKMSVKSGIICLSEFLGVFFGLGMAFYVCAKLYLIDDHYLILYLFNGAFFGWAIGALVGIVVIGFVSYFIKKMIIKLKEKSILTP